MHPGPPERTEALADRVTEIEKQVERIVGLDYDAFTRSVVLPQGQFDAFLKGEAKERRKILVALLNLHVYERMQEAANRRAGDARREAEFIGGQLGSDYAEATPAALESKRTAQSRGRGGPRLGRDGAHPPHRGRRRRAALAHGARREALALAHESAQATEALARAEKRAPRAAAAERRARAGEARASGALVAGLPVDEGRLSVLLDARPRVRAARRPADQARGGSKRRPRGRPRRSRLAATTAKAAEKAVAPAEKAVPRPEPALDAAQAEREALHRQHAAQELRRTLKPGEPCPVCTQAVVLLPPAAAPALGDAEARVRAAQARSRRRPTPAFRGAARRRSALEASRRASSPSPPRPTRQLGEIDQELASVRAAIGPAGFAESALRRARGPAAADRDGAAPPSKRRARRGPRPRPTGSAWPRSSRASPPASPRPTPRSPRPASGPRALRQRREAAQATVDDAMRGVSELVARARPGASRPPPAATRPTRSRPSAAAAQTELAACAATAARLGAEAAELERRIARAAELLEKKKTLDASAAVAQTLAQHLRADQFLAYVLEEALRRLAADGSRHLRQLSQGRYSLECEGQEFSVVDHWNADARRSVKTLSGGETFLASLGLALALAESLASLSAADRVGEALESLFLDEGFGTLDPETLGQVVQAIEALQGGERMVGVITHLPELAEQMPARVSVGRSERGATLTIG